jgi:hypothetical protein
VIKNLFFLFVAAAIGVAVHEGFHSLGLTDWTIHLLPDWITVARITGQPNQFWQFFSNEYIAYVLQLVTTVVCLVCMKRRVFRYIQATRS